MTSVRWLLASCQFHCIAQKCEKCSTRYCAAFVWGSLQLLCGGGDMVESNIDAVPAPPCPILLFPFRSDSCWDRLLGDHIPGTKRAQLVWTGLSDTTSCSGCEGALSMQASHVMSLYLYMHSIIGCGAAVCGIRFKGSLCWRDKRWFRFL